ncbi:hypothetical protein ABZ468_45570 [Streptomyces sp. NPDC005708]|uniref:hypothetical protein n=1 Tax=Streptomyces sp. NPDC005708 TaxID=3154564 RepID=UPI0033FAE745
MPESETPSEALLDNQARAEARAEIDAIVARQLFRLDRKQLEHILTTFPTLERSEIRKCGTYRTRDLVLAAYDCMAAAGLTPDNPHVEDENCISALTPPPGHGPRHPASPLAPRQERHGP